MTVLEKMILDLNNKKRRDDKAVEWAAKRAQNRNDPDHPDYDPALLDTRNPNINRGW